MSCTQRFVKGLISGPRMHTLATNGDELVVVGGGPKVMMKVIWISRVPVCTS
jgi:hypothetical protein